MSAEDAVLTIYRLPSQASYPKIVPATPERFWMDITTEGWARRCLPLLIANQAGWFILNEDPFEVTWDGSNSITGLRFHFPEGRRSTSPASMFGYGVVTWTPPFLFRTPPGINLWARGPANYPKDGICPLEGIVETDWLSFPFTANWKITSPRKTIKFERDEPICLITPVRRYEADRLRPVLRNLNSNPEVAAQYEAWYERRIRAVEIAGADGSGGAGAVPGQGHYIRGEDASGARFEQHQTKLAIHAPEELEPEPPLEALPAEETPVGGKGGLLRRLLGRQ